MTLEAWPGAWLDMGVFLLAVALDRTLPEPPAALHPVVWMGKAVHLLERMAPESGPSASLLAGVTIVAIVLVLLGGAGWLAARALRSLGPIPYLLGGAVLLRTTFTVTGLVRAAARTERALGEDRLPEARTGLRSLVSRDTRTLTPPPACPGTSASVCAGSRSAGACARRSGR